MRNKQVLFSIVDSESDKLIVFGQVKELVGLKNPETHSGGVMNFELRGEAAGNRDYFHVRHWFNEMNAKRSLIYIQKTGVIQAELIVTEIKTHNAHNPDCIFTAKFKSISKCWFNPNNRQQVIS